MNPTCFLQSESRLLITSSRSTISEISSSFISSTININFFYNDLFSWSLFSWWNWNWYVSNSWNLLHHWYRNWNLSFKSNSFKNWILEMMNIVLLIICLKYRLYNSFFSRNINDLSSKFCILNWFFVYGINPDFLIISSNNFQIDVFSLYNRLNYRLSNNFSTWSINSFSSVLFFYIRFSLDRI